MKGDRRMNLRLAGLLAGSIVIAFLLVPLVAVKAAAEDPPVFVLKWGSYGAGDGQFNYPYGVAVNSAGDIYVVDYFNHRIQKFGGSGTFLAKWGTQGSGNGQFYWPWGVAVDSLGDIYVVEYIGDRIQKFTGSGVFLGKWGSHGSGEGQLDGARGIAVDSAGNVYVADTFNHRIQKFTGSGSFLGKWGSYGIADGQFNMPVGVAVDSLGNVYVADLYNYRIQKFSDTGEFLAKWGIYGTGDGQFVWPYGVAADSVGNVYVTDYQRIQKFNGNGTFLVKWGASGSGDGQFRSPHDVTVNLRGDIYVSDRDNSRIQKFTPRPVANAGPDQPVHPGGTVTLDGSGSSDSWGAYPLSYSWSVASAPDGSAASLSNTAIVNPSFTPDLMGDYALQLVVTNSRGISSTPDNVNVSTYNTAPFADAGSDRSVVHVGSMVTLGDGHCYDNEGDPLTYSWSITSRPAGSFAALSYPASPTPSFIADAHGDYEFQLVVSDPWGGTASDTVKVSFTNVAPVANAGSTQSVNVGATVHLDGSASTDANGDLLAYKWALASVPEGSSAVLSDPSAVKPTFVADLTGSFVASLVVNDGFTDSAASNITVTATSISSSVIEVLRNAITAINGMDSAAFKNPNMKKALTNKVNAAILDMQNGLYPDALQKLQNDVLKKMSGCGTSGIPDKTDWVMVCGGGPQADAYNCLMQALDLLWDM